MLTYNPQTDTILCIAKQRGSTATTHAGAKRYLLAHLPAPSLPRVDSDCWGRMAHNVRAYLRATDEQRAEKILRGNGLLARDEAEAIAEYYTRRDLRWDDSAWPYRRSDSRWAGGDHDITITIDDEPGVDGGSTRAWSANGKWSGTNSYASLAVTARAIQCFPTLRAGGLIVLDAVPVGHREYQMLWIEQGRGFELHEVEGWYIRGHHIRGGSLPAARKRVRRERKKTVRTQLAARLAARHRDWALTHVFVGPQDSLAGGNCPAGTEQYLSQLRRELGEIGGLRCDALLARRTDTYALRAVNAAIARYLREHGEQVPRTQRLAS